MGDDRLRVSRRLYRSALADAISWTESLGAAQAGTPSENPDDRNRLADYRRAYSALTGSKIQDDRPASTLRSVEFSIDDDESDLRRVPMRPITEAEEAAEDTW